MEDDYERILLVKQECFVYRLPPRPSNRGYKAADWGLDKPSWVGRMKVVTKGNKLSVKFEDKLTGQLFANAPIEEYPGVAVESVTDSSRYFVIRICDENGRHAFIGAGFGDRGDAFDFNVSLQDHFKQVRTEEKIQTSSESEPQLNLGLKEGQTFTIKLGNSSAAKPRPKPKGGGLLLPPPPGGNPPSKPTPVTSTQGQEWGEFSSAGSNNNWVQF